MNYKDMFFSFEKKKKFNAQVKTKIAARALELVQPGDEIFLGAGTTIACLGELLARSGKHFMLKIWTNNFFVVDLWLKQYEMFFAENFVGITSGEISHKNISIVNIQPPFSRIPKLFLGTPGISLRGLESDDTYTVQQIEQLAKRAGEIIILADSSKVGRECTYQTRSMRMIKLDINKGRPYTLVTDETEGPDASRSLERLKAAGLRVLTV